MTYGVLLSACLFASAAENGAMLELSALGTPQAAPDIVAVAPVPRPRKPGLTLLRAVEPVPDYSIKMVNVIHVDPANYEVRAVLAQTVLHRSRATLPEMMAAVPEAMAGMNASFFSLKDGGLVGFFMEGGKVKKYQPHPSMDRIFFTRADGTAGVSYGTELDPKGVASAVSGKSSWDQESPSARTALCIDSGGHVRLVSAYPVKTLGWMTEYLRTRETCSKIVHLDGGGSTQTAFRGPGGLSIGWERKHACEKPQRESPAECFRKVPAFLLVLPRR
ncbi:MAG: phosphodiester glycosidase family protein [Elusimicrobiota bacterium]